jgi:hypothetical protein
MTSSSVTVFSGQRACVLTANQRAYVGALAQEQSGGKITYAPVLGVAQSGHLLEVDAAASADRQQVTMTIRPQVAQLMAIESAEQKMPSGESKPVQRPLVHYHTFKTTVTMPGGQTLVLWNFDDEWTATGRSATSPEARKRLFLFIKPLVNQPTTQPDLKTLPAGR